MQLSSAQLGFIRGLGTVVLMGVLSFLGNVANLNGVLSVSAATVVAALAASLEHYLAEQKPGTALFGAVSYK